MELTISATEKRRLKQIDYNQKNNITPQQIVKSRKSTMGTEYKAPKYAYSGLKTTDIAADPDFQIKLEVHSVVTTRITHISRHQSPSCIVARTVLPIPFVTHDTREQRGQEPFLWPPLS